MDQYEKKLKNTEKWVQDLKNTKFLLFYKVHILQTASIYIFLQCIMVGENTLERLELGYKTREMETKAKILFQFENFYKKVEFKCRLKYLYDVSTKAHINFVGYYKNNILFSHLKVCERINFCVFFL